MTNLQIYPQIEFKRVLEEIDDQNSRLTVFSSMCRLNTLVAIKKAGSGHLGSSFSSLDLVTWLYLEEMNVADLGINDPGRDIFFSSKGHDVPGLYSVLYAIGIISEDKLLKLRKLDGLDGHPEKHIDGLEASTGSLGMGISKARGMSWAKRYQKLGGRVFVMTGDGELQEGQIWEGLQNTVQQNVDITVIVDFNKIQTDMPVKEIVNLHDIEAKFADFGWHVKRCSGHDFPQISSTFESLNRCKDKPKVLIADTIKGKGVSFMESISDMVSEEGKYYWHSGAPNDADFEAGFNEIVSGISGFCNKMGFEAPQLRPVAGEKKSSPARPSKIYLSEVYGKELLVMAESHSEIVVLDGDLAADCRIRGFENRFPERFIENGIAEQDMVSMAGGLAAQGLLPVVNTFASFLAARANEQIYNNACEKTKIIYMAHFAGMIPAGPGKSHQSVRDISLFGSIPNMIILQPGTPLEVKMALRYCVEEAIENCMIRLNIGPSPREIELPDDYALQPGIGAVIKTGNDAVIFAYGAVMLHEALVAAEIAEAAGFSLGVINMPWLNRIDSSWLENTIEGINSIYVLEDHMNVGGLGDRLLDTMNHQDLLKNVRFHRFGLDELPMCGTPAEVLNYHGLDGYSIIQRIFKSLDMDLSALEHWEGKVFDTVESAQ